MDERNLNSAAEAPAGTGDPVVDDVLSGLERASELPVADHAALYLELHDGLLTALNEEPANQGKPSVPGPESAPGTLGTSKPGPGA